DDLRGRESARPKATTRSLFPSDLWRLSYERPSGALTPAGARARSCINTLACPPITLSRRRTRSRADIPVEAGMPGKRTAHDVHARGVLARARVNAPAHGGAATRRLKARGRQTTGVSARHDHRGHAEGRQQRPPARFNADE